MLSRTSCILPGFTFMRPTVPYTSASFTPANGASIRSAERPAIGSLDGRDARGTGRRRRPAGGSGVAGRGSVDPAPARLGLLVAHLGSGCPPPGTAVPRRRVRPTRPRPVAQAIEPVAARPADRRRGRGDPDARAG